MGILRWSFAGLVALLLGSGFALLSGSLILGAVLAAGVLLVASYLSRKARDTYPGRQETQRGRKRTGAPGYGAAYTAPADGGASAGGDCGFGGDGGGAGGC